MIWYGCESCWVGKRSNYSRLDRVSSGGSTFEGKGCLFLWAARVAVVIFGQPGIKEDGKKLVLERVGEPCLGEMENPDIAERKTREADNEWIRRYRGRALDDLEEDRGALRS